jgi:heterodisulfide reductase subunit C1
MISFDLSDNSTAGMINNVNKLHEDIRFLDGLTACLNCGVCTAICPAAEFTDYDPRKLMTMVQTGDPAVIEQLLSSDTIWNCGQCMSCKTRCPRDNTPAMVVQALRRLSQETGFFTLSEKGLQQVRIKRSVGHNILEHGYCVHPALLHPDEHPEQGPVWQWVYENLEAVYDRLSANLGREGEGAVRKLDRQTMDELHSIFEATGGKRFFELIEHYASINSNDHES